ncbi:hypothetical protein [Clostridium sp. JN-1]|uniref:hypothetical protein n=1 Tax=Clostridium sp. JN-1 TaxID=2483110 RepID=UPI000F0B6574|nr:hypothetical protein [Clostridium sp. JN-1]
MPGILNVSGAYDVNTRKLFKKLTFEVGQDFMARVINVKKLEGEVLLKLIDGWKFSAKLENDLDKLPGGLVKFQVEGYEDGQIKLKIVSNTNDTLGESNLKESFDSILSKSDISVTKDDYPVLYKMVKHDIPLTKDNISYVKTLTDFTEKLKEPGEEDNFISNYIKSKGIPNKDARAQDIRNVLKSFFSEFKGLSLDGLLTFIENKIDLSKVNIKSFNEIFNGSLKIYNDAQSINDAVNSTNNVNPKDSRNMFLGKNIDVILSGKGGQDVQDQSVSSQGEQVDISKDMKGQNLENLNPKGDKSVKDDSLNSTKNMNLDNSDVKVEKKSDFNIKQNDDFTNVQKPEALGNQKDIKIHKGLNVLVDEIKQQINEKTEHVKNIIKSVMDKSNDTNLENYNNLTAVLDKNINDFKVFNTVSNQYYYMDLPLNIDNYEYNFKLMVKDDRKKGKKLDSTDLKIAASVNTENIGVVDAYIAVNKSNMKVDIKCDSNWVQFLDKGKDIITNQLTEMGYNTYISVDKRKEEMNLVNCRDFFEDKHASMINVRA